MSSSQIIRVIVLAIAVIGILAALIAGRMYRHVYKPNVTTPDGKPFDLFIPSGSEYGEVLQILESKNLLKDPVSFQWVAEKKKYPGRVHPGRYVIRQGMSNSALVNMLRNGLQEPVRLVINLARNQEELANKIALQLEPTAGEVMHRLADNSFLGKYGFDRYTVLGMFIPNTYEFWWNTSADELFDRMHKEYEKVWNNRRKDQAAALKLTPNQVSTLASIVLSETNQSNEYRRIAGVYMNRIRIGMRLQADPTVKFALGDPQRKRVLKKDTEIDSPYNTYRYAGLPPGPIALPTIRAIDAVLHFEQHDYLYFCAKDDFSGHHAFARTLDQHNKNARSYQKALNRRNILK